MTLASSFVHLHVHSAYSLSEGAIKVEKLAALAAGAGMPALAITDSSNLFGAMEFSQACVAKGIQPIIGCQLALSRTAADERPEAARMAPEPLVALAMDAQGLDNLQRLSSLSFLRDDPSGKPSLDLDTLLRHAPGLFLLTGGTTGPLGRLLAEGRRAPAARLLSQLKEAFGDRLAVEIQRHGLPIERTIEPGLLALADEAALPIVASNDVYFADASMHEAHDALLCIAEGVALAQPERRRVTPEHWFKPAAEMRRLFADLPDACDNSVAIARSCAVMVEARKPALPISPKVQAGMTEAETVQDMARRGLEARLDADGVAEQARVAYRERLAFELGVIERMGFSGYFLIVADFIQWAKQNDIPVGPGRGSGAGSVAAWALTITDLDPMRFGLLFERFLNPERVSMPDFDIDFCQTRRDEVIQYVRREYGADRVAQIITYGKLQARAAVKDVGRVLGMPYGQVDKIASLIPNNPASPVSLKDAVAGEPRLQEMQQSEEAVDRLLQIALKIEGLYRHASTHAAGVVIGQRPLIETVPLYRDPKSGMLVTQYSMKHVEQASLVKFDFLGLKTLTVLQRAVRMLAERGTKVDLTKIPLDDPKTYDMLRRGDAAGVFQFESQGMRDCLRQMRVDRFEDLIAAVALYRPGPMANIPAYCARKAGETWEAPHPKIKHILDETYGIMVYQEQVMQISQDLAGYSLGSADLLRRAMGKKNRAEMEMQRKVFIQGATERGVGPENAGEIFDLMERFADYGFNKSHAAAYALVSYQTAWMKANYPVEFIAAAMCLDLSDTDKLAVHMQEASRLKIRVLPPDVNRSAADFAVEVREDGTSAIRYALGAVKRVGEGAMHDLVAERKKGGPYRSLAEFAGRVDPKHINKMALENLAKAGAFDCLDSNRAKVAAGAEVILRRAQASAEERTSAQFGLFGGPAGSGRVEPIRMPALNDWPDLERLSYEADAIGFHLSGHPLDAYAGVLRRLKVTTFANLEARVAAGQGGGRVKLAGTVVSAKERPTRTGSRMAWVRLSDTSGGFEVTFFSEVLNRSRDILKEGSTVLVGAEAKMNGEKLQLTAESVESLEKVAAMSAPGIKLWVEHTMAVNSVKEILERAGEGRGRVIMVPKTGPKQEVEIPLKRSYNVSPRTMQAIKVIPGVSAVEELDDAPAPC